MAGTGPYICGAASTWENNVTEKIREKAENFISDVNVFQGIEHALYMFGLQTNAVLEFLLGFWHVSVEA